MENKCLKKFAELKKDIDEFKRLEDNVYEGEWSHYKFEFLFFCFSTKSFNLILNLFNFSIL